MVTMSPPRAAGLLVLGREATTPLLPGRGPQLLGPARRKLSGTGP
jgi:hypothetical protein